jgi:hypothetical protein
MLREHVASGRPCPGSRSSHRHGGRCPDRISRTAPTDEKKVNILFNRSTRRAGRGSGPERRHGNDRRMRIARALFYGSFHPRRHGPRRAGENRLGAVDWYHPWWLAVAALIVALCAADAILTLVLIGRGAYEVNPLLAALIGGSAIAFVVVKIGLTGAGVILLTLLSRVKAFGLPVALVLYAIVIGYGALVAYELTLLAHS